MPSLPITQLRVNTLYRCALSGQLVLVVNITELAGHKSAYIRYYNHTTGQYQVTEAHNHQLAPANPGESRGPAPRK